MNRRPPAPKARRWCARRSRPARILPRDPTGFLKFLISECASCTRVAGFVTHDARTNVSPTQAGLPSGDTTICAGSWLPCPDGNEEGDYDRDNFPRSQYPTIGRSCGTHIGGSGRRHFLGDAGPAAECCVYATPLLSTGHSFTPTCPDASHPGNRRDGRICVPNSTARASRAGTRGKLILPHV